MTEPYIIGETQTSFHNQVVDKSADVLDWHQW